MIRPFFVFGVPLLSLTISFPATAQYRGTPFVNGGSVTGTVKLKGSLSEFNRMEITKDQVVCGGTVTSPRLVSGRDASVQNAVVYLEGMTSGKPFERNPKTIVNQTRCEYIPHVVIVPVGSSLEISNSDPVLHNVHGYSNQKSVFNIAQPIKGQRSTIRQSVFSDPGFIDLTCDAGHPWMSGIVVVASHPYYSITGEGGRYRLDNIPPGKYRLVMWHEGINVTSTEKEKGKIKKYVYEAPYTIEREVTVTGGRTTEQNFDLVVR